MNGFALWMYLFEIWSNVFKMITKLHYAGKSFDNQDTNVTSYFEYYYDAT